MALKGAKKEALRWKREMAAFKKRNRKFKKQGTKVVNRFRDEEGTRDHPGTSTGWQNLWFRLNLFHSNIITLMSMLYGNLPRVDASRKYADSADDQARVAAEIFERMLNSGIEDGDDEVSDVLRCSLEDRLLPGLGVARVRYNAETQTTEIPAEVDEEGNELVAAYTDVEVISEEAPIEYVHWRDFAWGYTRTWKNLPWMAFRRDMTKDEIKKKFGEEWVDKLEWKRQNPVGDEYSEPYDASFKDPKQTAEVWEIWCKKDRKVCWWSDGCDQILDSKDDFLGLKNFWPIPRPMAANVTTTLYHPKSDYSMAQDLYSEIDVLQTRIATITQAVKVVGVYDKNNEGVKRMLKEGVENDLIPVDNWAMFAEKGGLKGTIDWFPIQDVANVLERLRDLRNETIELLYQVTGLSDILRGTAQQYSGVGTNELKAKFASIRVQALQDEFARFASELMTLKAEVISKHFSQETIVKESNIENTTDRDLIGPALGIIKSPEETAYRVAVKPESVAMIDYAELKAERTEYLNAVATFMQSSAALVQQEPGAAPVLAELLKWGLAGFKGSQQIEGVMDKAIAQMMQKAQQPQQQQPSPEQIKAQAEMQKQQFEMQKMQAQFQMEMQKLMAELRAEILTIQAKTEGKVTEEQIQAVAKITEINAQHGARMTELRSANSEN